jgi:hypothetical protein
MKTIFSSSEQKWIFVFFQRIPEGRNRRNEAIESGWRKSKKGRDEGFKREGNTDLNLVKNGKKRKARISHSKSGLAWYWYCMPLPDTKCKVPHTQPYHSRNRWEKASRYFNLSLYGRK